MNRSLYSKILTWLVLNFGLIILSGLVFLGYIAFANSEGILPAYVFSKNIENSLRQISSNLQYRPTYAWPGVMESYNKESSPRFHLVSLDDPGLHYTRDYLPEQIWQIAERLPRALFTLCPDPERVFRGGGLLSYDNQNMEAGLTSAPPALYARAGNPFHYWYGRAVFVPDDTETTHYVLIAVESNTFSGNGLFFNLRIYLIVIAVVMVVSCLWWLPFIWNTTKPLVNMVQYAEHLTDNISDLNIQSQNADKLPLKRKDEIGCLARSLSAMANRLTQQMTGQRQFIRHIAHELNTPLARCKLGLAVLEKRLDGDAKLRVQTIMSELDDLSGLTDDVLEFLRAQAAPEPPKLECLPLNLVLWDLLDREYETANIQVNIANNMHVLCDKLCLRQAVRNLLNNALIYAGEDKPIEMLAMLDTRQNPNRVRLSVCDHGPGVDSSELGSLDQPFYRSQRARQNHPGGSGLGLSIVKSCMEQCGGSIDFQNLPDNGFCASLYLAICQPE